DQQVADLARLEASYVLLREIDTHVGEAAEKDADIAFAGGAPLAGSTVANLPPALPHQPFDESGYGRGRAFEDTGLGEIARTVGLRHGERDDPGLTRRRFNAAPQRQVVRDLRREGGVDELLNRGRGAGAAGELAQ